MEQGNKNLVEWTLETCVTKVLFIKMESNYY